MTIASPVPARAHANMTVAEREFSFDALLAEFGETGAIPVQVPDAAAENVAATENAAPSERPSAAQAARAAITRLLTTKPSPEVLKLSALIALAALSLTLVFVALGR
jgi:hypothetical protein